MGAALQERPRDEFVVSTKVGRLLEPAPGATGDDDEGFAVPATHRRRRDYSRDGVLRSLESSLERLGLDRIDLYIIHWPAGGATWAWPGMEQAKERGYARSIGASNFSVRELDEVVGIATQVPTVNQIHLNPFAYRRELLDACARYGIAAEAYSPLGTGRHLGDATVAEVAARAGRTPAQVLVRWGLQRGFIVLPKSTHKERIEENGALFDFALPDEDMTALDALDRTGGTGQAVESKWWR
jgi:2,5-diketo-D-gluconate reductase A